MAYSYAELSATEITDRSSDKPTIVVCSQLTALGSTYGARWISGINGSASGTDISASGYSAKLGVDGFPSTLTKPNAAGTGFTYTMDYSTTPIDFDCVGFINHNFDSTAMTALTIETSDAANFSTNKYTVLSINPSTLLSADTRFADLSIYHTGSTALRYSDVPYVRVNMTYGSSQTPIFGQLILGRSYQFKYNPDNPWDPSSQISGVEDFVSRSGAITRNVAYRGQRVLNASLPLDSSTYQAHVTSWFSGTQHGTKPFLWIDNPNSAPNTFYLMVAEKAELSFPYDGPHLRRFDLSAVEQGGEFLAMEQ